MRVLILSISKKSGHQQAANAIEQSFIKNYPNAVVTNYNFFDFIRNPLMEKMVNSTYLSILKNTPEIWDYLYDNESVCEKTVALRQFVDKKNSFKFKKAIDEFQPSVIVCTQAFPCEVAACLKKDNQIDHPLVAVVTDFITHSYWVNPYIDLYIVPTHKTAETLTNRGIYESRIKVLGIPINPIYEYEYSSMEIEAIQSKLGLSKSVPTVLIMGGSQGFGPIKNLIKLLNESSLEFQILVVTGFNTKLRRELRQIKNQIKYPIFIFGYINNIHELMSVSDILITKPGGMTSTEALVKRLPMIIVDPLPGQEEKNSQFLVNVGAALRIDDEYEIKSVIEGLITDKNRLEEFQKNMDRLVVHHSSQKIVDAIANLKSNNTKDPLIYV